MTCESITVGKVKGYGASGKSLEKAIKKGERDFKREGKKICVGGTCEFGTCVFRPTQVQYEYEVVGSPHSPAGVEFQVTVTGTGDCSCG